MVTNRRKSRCKPVGRAVLGGLDSAVLLAAGRRRGSRRAPASTSAPASPGKRRSCAAVERLLGRAALRRRRAAAGDAARRHARRLSAAPLGDPRRGARHSTRRTKTSTSKAATSCCCGRRRSTWRARGLVARADRAARRQSVSGCDAGVLRRDGARAVARDSASPIAIEAPFASTAQGGRDRAGSVARRAVRADAVVHAADRRTALRPLQQVPRAERWVSRGGDRRSDPLPGAAVAVGCASSAARGRISRQRAFNVIEPSPVWTRSRLPP